MTLAFDAPDPSDGEVLRRVRSGQAAAFGVLYQRHVMSARRLARSLVSAPAEADDIVAEVFAATFGAIRRGSGPHEDFLAYVLRSIRRECGRSWRHRSRQAILAPDVAEGHADAGDEFGRHDERELLRQAFVALPARMQAVLWHVEVDGLSHAEIARRTRSTPQAIAQLTVRARRSLGDRYLQAHIAATASPAVPARCAATRASLAEFVRGTASARRQRSVREHLAECRACADAHGELCIVNDRLRGLTLLAIAGAVVVPKRWVAGVAMRTGGWLLGSTAPLTAAATVVVLATAVPTSAPAAPAAAVDQALDAAPARTDSRATAAAAAGRAPATTVASDAATPIEPMVATTVTATTTAAAPTEAAPVSPGEPPAQAVVTARPGTAPPVADPPGVAVAVTVDVPPVPLPSLPLLGQVSDALDVPPVALDVGIGDTVESGVGETTIDASIGDDGVGVGVGVAGTVDVPLPDAPPIEVPPIEVTPIEVPVLGG